MSFHHEGPYCSGCETKLQNAHPSMRAWFHRVKGKYENAHVAWSARDQLNQEQCVAQGKSDLHWPHSPHNRMIPIDRGNPSGPKRFESFALDLFQINGEGLAIFDPLFYAQVNADNEAAGLPIFWGKHWPHLGDSDHFQWKEEEEEFSPLQAA